MSQKSRFTHYPRWKRKPGVGEATYTGIPILLRLYQLHGQKVFNWFGSHNWRWDWEKDRN